MKCYTYTECEYVILDMKLQPHLKNVTELILQANKDSDDEVALEACEFWYVFCN